MNTSCTKPANDTPDPTIKTLEQTYPTWKNLTWVSTDGDGSTIAYPRIDVSIIDNIVKVNQPTGIGNGVFHGSYTVFNITGNNVTLGTQYDGMTGTFINSGTQITLTTKGLSTTSHVYVLQIN